MELKYFLIISLLSFAALSTGSIDSFKNFPDAYKIVQKYASNYSSKFKVKFKDGPIYSGDGTAYGSSTNGGNCLFPKVEYYKDMMYAALNNAQYNEDFGCGLCALAVSDSNPHKAIRIRVLDQCPECAHGSLDFSDKAFYELTGMSPARVKITWALIPCDEPVGEYPALVGSNAPVKFQFKTGSTQWWSEVQVFNTKYPVASLEAYNNGHWISMYRKAYNYWGSNEGIGAPPYKFKVTLADSSVIIAEGVELAVPGDDEGDAFSSGRQTVQ